MWTNPQFPPDLFTLTKEILKEKLHLLCDENYQILEQSAIKCYTKKTKKVLHHICQNVTLSWFTLCQNVQAYGNLFRSSRPKVFSNKGVFKNFTKLTGKHRCQSLFFNKVAGLRYATLSKKGLCHRCFIVSFANFWVNVRVA